MIPIMPYTNHTQTLLFPCLRTINFCLIRTLKRQKLHYLADECYEANGVAFSNGQHYLTYEIRRSDEFAISLTAYLPVDKYSVTKL